MRNAMFVILLTVFNAFGLEFMWETDLATNLNGMTTYSEMKQFSNNDVSIIFNDGSTSNRLIIVNQAGVVKYTDDFRNDFFVTQHIGRGSAEQFCIRTEISSEVTLRIYEYNGSTYSITNVITPRYSLPLYNGAISEVFYTLDGTLLRQYAYSEIPPTLSSDITAGIEDSNFKLSWNSVPGSSYQIQSSTDLTNWVNVGETIIGTGSPMTWGNSISNSNSFFRVQKK